jgi:signal transduction histidine kinase
MIGFTVDTHVFRELGELLVGRDSTALVELIKNSYDADATEVVVYGEHLYDTERGTITVADDGIGMSGPQFTDGFLRIAARTKDVGTRKSPRFQRRYTGAKGIGRLAAHKLAKFLQIESVSWKADESPTEGVLATIDWDLVEQKETLDDVPDSGAILVQPFASQVAGRPGTKITLRRLRRKWTKTEHGRFLEEVQSFEPPLMLTSPLPSAVVSERLLFDAPTIRESGKQTPFTVKLEGELAPPEDYWSAAIQAANWVIEIDAYTEPGSVLYCVAPTAKTLAELENSVPVSRLRMTHPGGKEGPFFQARIMVRTGQVSGSENLKAWSGRAHGVRVFMEGFRVLPYGEPKNDWLALDRDYAGRAKDFLSEAVAKSLFPALPTGDADDRPGLTHLPNKNYFGGVFLTQNGAPGLRTLVNREGFVPDENYERLETIVRTGIDLTTRLRAAATTSQRERRRAIRSQPAGSPPSTEERPSFDDSLTAAVSHASAARRYTAAGDSAAAGRELDSALARMQNVTTASVELADQSAMLRVLASVGTQLSSFVHELNSLLGMSEAIERALNAVLDTASELKRPSRARLSEVAKSIADLRRHLERHASYLIDVVTPDARRRRSRQRLHERFDAAARLIEVAATRRNISISNAIPADLKSPPVFAAELTAIFANLLTNAVKAAGDDGKIRSSGVQAERGTIVRVENTGVAVKLNEGERWFRPFESSTTTVDSILGQGMGLGLTITRRILEEYGATIQFVKPTAGFSTALEIVFNG